MKKGVSGYLLGLVLVAVIGIVYLPMNTKATNNNADSTVVKVIQDSEVNHALKEGDPYKIQLSVSDNCMNNVTTAQIYESYRSFDGRMDDLKSFEATVTHDEDNHAYNITLESTIHDEATGIWCLGEVDLKDDSNNHKLCDLSNNEMEQYRHYVIDDSTTNQLVLNCEHQDMKVGDSFQLKAYVLPSLEQTDVEWICEGKTVATVDNNGMVTAKEPGTAYIYAKYNGKEYYFMVSVTDANGAGRNGDFHQLFNEIKVVSNSADGQNLQTGEQYKVVISVADEGMNQPTLAKLSMIYTSFTGENKLYLANATAFTHDDANHCYLVTLEGTVDDDELGNYSIGGVQLMNDNNEYYVVEFFEGNNARFVIGNDTSGEQDSQSDNTSVVSDVDNVQNATISVASDVTEINETVAADEAAVTNQAAVIDGENPQTGDHFPVIYVAIAGISLCVVALLVGKEIRKRKFN